MEEKELEQQELNEVLRINRGLEELFGDPQADGDPAFPDAEGSVLRQKEHADGEASDGKKRRKGGLFAVLVVVLVLAVIAAGTAGSLLFLRGQGRKGLMAHEQTEGIELAVPETAESSEGGHKVRYNGKYYVRNEDVIAILGLGIDRTEEYKEQFEAGELAIGERGQADTIVLAALDTVTGQLDLINISRDSMADVEVYNVDGEYVGTEKMQICLAYAYGATDAESCENTMRAVSTLMYGIPIDAYAAVELPAISALNDAIGGVEVTIRQDLSFLDAAFTEGAVVTLDGNQAHTYVRWRGEAAVDANNARMQRQKQYAAAFMQKVFSMAKDNAGVVVTLYQAARDYMTTDIGLSEMVYLASLAMKSEFSEGNIVTVPGEVTASGDYAEYHVDEDAMYEIILSTFYTEVTEDGTPVESAETTDAEQTNQSAAAEPEEQTVTVDRTLLR